MDSPIQNIKYIYYRYLFKVLQYEKYIQSAESEQDRNLSICTCLGGHVVKSLGQMDILEWRNETFSESTKLNVICCRRWHAWVYSTLWEVWGWDIPEWVWCEGRASSHQNLAPIPICDPSAQNQSYVGKYLIEIKAKNHIEVQPNYTQMFNFLCL